MQSFKQNLQHLKNKLNGLFAFLIVVRVTNELSTIFINIRWIFAALDMKRRKIYLINGIAILVVFGACRIASIPIIWYIFYTYMCEPLWTDSFPLALKIVLIYFNAQLDMLNLYWYMLIVKGFYKHLVTRKSYKLPLI